MYVDLWSECGMVRVCLGYVWGLFKFKFFFSGHD